MIGFCENRNPQESTHKLLGATVGITLKKEEIMLQLPNNIAKTIPTQLVYTAFILIVLLN